MTVSQPLLMMRNAPSLLHSSYPLVRQSSSKLSAMSTEEKKVAISSSSSSSDYETLVFEERSNSTVAEQHDDVCIREATPSSIETSDIQALLSLKRANIVEESDDEASSSSTDRVFRRPSLHQTLSNDSMQDDMFTLKRANPVYDSEDDEEEEFEAPSSKRVRTGTSESEESMFLMDKSFTLNGDLKLSFQDDFQAPFVTYLPVQRSALQA